MVAGTRLRGQFNFGAITDTLVSKRVAVEVSPELIRHRAPNTPDIRHATGRQVFVATQTAEQIRRFDQGMAAVMGPQGEQKLANFNKGLAKTIP